MSQYTPTTGRILQINWLNMGQGQMGCGLTLTLNTMDQGIIHMNVDGSTYILNNQRLMIGDVVTCFYSLTAPVPLIYPPTYRAVAIVHTNGNTYATLDEFTQESCCGRLTNSDNTLILNLSNRTTTLLPNGQLFGGTLSGKLLLVIYSTTTRSIPAQTTPETIIVFCAVS